MIFTLLTFLAALSTAAVAEWFSIVGIISIYAGAPYNAGLILGIVLGFAKLVNASWLYRNWDTASWKLKIPLIYFLLALMITTSMGVFGFLTKSHLEQGAATTDNSAKVERLDQQIAREKSVIADNEKVIAQLDAAINSYIGKDRTDRAILIRKSQAPQRKQLRNDIDTSHKMIDTYSEDRLKLTSEVRALAIEIGPIRYIAELFYGTSGDQTANIESAVKMFTLLIVSTLDPLAIILLIAANHQLLRRRDEEKKKTSKSSSTAESVNAETTGQEDNKEDNSTTGGRILTAKEEPGVPYIEDIFLESISARKDAEVDEPLHEKYVEEDHGYLDVNKTDRVRPIAKENLTMPTFTWPTIPAAPPAEPRISTPLPLSVEYGVSSNDNTDVPEVGQSSAPQPAEVQDPVRHYNIGDNAVLRELHGNYAHFLPERLNEGEKSSRVQGSAATEYIHAPESSAQEIQEMVSSRPENVQETNNSRTKIEHIHNESQIAQADNKYPVLLSWLKEFKGD